MEKTKMMYGTSSAHPSLALIKYWGKADSNRNLPATPSLAVTLDGLTTRTEAALSPILDGGFKPDAVSIGGEIQDIKRFEAFFKEFRRIIAARQPERGRFSISADSSSDFPTAAGLASSSSGFAALSCACAEAAGVLLSREELSSLARTGSASAARSIYGGFTRLDAGSSHAVQIFDEHWWPEFRIIVLELENEPKAISSRQAMELTRITSPFYDSWVRDSEYLMEKAVDALKGKDLKTLGPLIRNSYLRMFGTMLAAEPPVIYWKPVSLSVIHLCEQMRASGLSVWETMDAGPQVKLFCIKDETDEICKQLNEYLPGLSCKICSPGAGPSGL